MVWDQKKFKRSVKKKLSKSPQLKTKFAVKLKTFEHNPFDSSLRTHKLSGILKDYWAFSVDYNIRIIFKFIDSKTALLIDIGSNDEVY